MKPVLPNTTDGIKIGDYLHVHPKLRQHCVGLFSHIQIELGWDSDRFGLAVLDFLEAMHRQSRARKAFRNN